MLGTIFDAVMLLVILICIIVGYKKGIITMIKPVRFYIAVYLGWTFRFLPLVQDNIVSKLIDKEGFRNGILEKINTVYAPKIDAAAAATVENEAARFDGVFGWLESLFSGLKQYCLDTFAEEGLNLTEKVVDYITEHLIGFIGGALGFIIVFIAAFIILIIVTAILQAIFSKGFLKVVNGILGASVGIVIGFIAAWLLSIVSVKLGGVFSPEDPQAVSKGVIGIVKWFYYSCPLSLLFGVK